MKDRWVIQFIPLGDQGGFAGVFFSEKSALKVFNDAVKAHKTGPKKDGICINFAFTDDNKTKYCVNLLSYTFLYGNMTEMIVAANEHKNAEVAEQAKYSGEAGFKGQGGAKYVEG